jgi:hypothetical protein
MKIRNIIISVLSTMVLGTAVAQELEYDDVYFNRKDREKQKALKRSELAVIEPAGKKKNLPDYDSDENVNPTDSYSARNVNPEFISRSNSEKAQTDNEDYFVNNYRYYQQSQFNSWNNNFNSWYNNPWYSSSYWASGLNSWNTPYYGGNYYSGFNDPWMNPWCNPYSYRSGWSLSSSYYWGSRWGYGGSMSYGWGNPYGGWGSSYGYSPYGGYYPSYGGYPSNVILVERNPGVVYGKRTSRSGGVISSYGTNPSQRTYSNTGSNSRSDNGRIKTQSQSEYYDRTWRSGSRQNANSGTTDNSSDSGRRTTTWDNDNSRTTRQQSNSSPSYDRAPTRSSSTDGGSRSTGGSHNNSNSGSRSSRGRGN